MSSVVPSPNDIRKLSKDFATTAENARPDENHVEDIETDEVSKASKSLSAERSSSDVQLVVHQKTASEPVVSMQDGSQHVKSNRSLSSVTNPQDCSKQQLSRRASSDLSSNKRLEEYHKWKMSGCKGDPPTKLKISQ